MAGNQLINLSSADGAKLLSDVQTGGVGSCCQSKLIDVFTKQTLHTSCGVASCALVLSAHSLALDQSTLSEPAYTEQNMFSMPTTMSVISLQKINRDGNKSIQRAQTSAKVNLVRVGLSMV